MIMNANTILKNGKIFTADKNNSICQAVAIKDGVIIATGSDSEVMMHATSHTEIIDLQGKMAMPGIIDSHMHPMWGAKQLSEDSLEYQFLDVDGVISEVQKVVDNESKIEASNPDKWIIVRAWECIGGATIQRSDLDRLTTKRPVILFSNDCHYIALNSRGLEILGIAKSAPTKLLDDGVIVLDEHGQPTGLIEDGAAMRYFDKITALNVEEGIKVFLEAQKKLNAQGITTIMDARAIEEEFDVFKAMQDKNVLNLRILGAYEVKAHDLKSADTFAETIGRIKSFKQKYSTENWEGNKPSLSIHQAKFFVDGMIPSKTAYLLEPYFENKGTKDNPQYVQTDFRGIPWFTQEQLEYAFVELAKNDLDPHMHTIADGAIEICLNAVEKMRHEMGDKDIRPAMAHLDVTAPHQYKRFADLKISANLSFQWSGYTQNFIDFYKEFLGEEQIKDKFETHGKFFDAGVNVAYNSDWPIDPLNEWYNFQVGLTRRIDADNPHLDSDRDLKSIEVLRAATINAAYALKKDDEIGSIEKGKFADIIVLNKDALSIDKTEFETIKVVQTIIGGKTVHKL